MGSPTRLPPICSRLITEFGDRLLDASGEPAGVFVLGGMHRPAEGDGCRRWLGDRLGLPEDAPGAFDVDRYDGHAASCRQVGGAASERLTPAIGAAATFGEDH